MDDNMKIGYCRFCGNSRMVKIEDGTDPDQEELNRLAAEQCKCPESVRWREQEAQREEMIGNIMQIMSEKWPAAADLLMGAISPLQKGLIEKITVKIDSIYTATMQRQGMNIKLRIVDKRNTEVTS